ncbi:MAG: hypothetical protein ALAOOOJD_02853 [bacterium]|nr:hypothetical protein [bacterium]
MKTYAEFLRGYIGKKGELMKPTGGEQSYWLFAVKKPSPEWGTAKLVDLGVDYAEFAVGNGFRIIPLSVLVLDVE